MLIKAGSGGVKTTDPHLWAPSIPRDSSQLADDNVASIGWIHDHGVRNALDTKLPADAEECAIT